MSLVSKNFITKRIIFILCFLISSLFLLIYFSNKNEVDNSFFEGEWSKDFKNHVFEIKFRKNDECTITLYYKNNKKIEKYDGSCFIDLEKKPFALDIIKIKNHKSIHTSLKIINENKILINSFSEIPKLRNLLINENISLKMTKVQ